MPVFRLALLLLLFGGLLIFLAQNWSPVIPLIFFGSQTPPLPIAIWILLFGVAGVFTSLLLQLLNRLSRGSTARPVERATPPPPPPRREDINPRREPQPRYTQPPAATPVVETEEWPVEAEEPESWVSDTRKGEEPWEETQQTEDWEEDWNIEEPPGKPTPSRPEFDRRSTSYEIPQEPKTISRSGSVYSYGYRDSQETEPESQDVASGKIERVYDAKYRVITPPYSGVDEQRESEDEEDWI